MDAKEKKSPFSVVLCLVISEIHTNSFKNSIFRRPFQYFHFRIFRSPICMGRPLSYLTANYDKDLSKILVD